MPTELLNLVNTKTWNSPQGADFIFKIYIGVGLITGLLLLATVIYRFFHTDDLGDFTCHFTGCFRRIFQSSLLPRLCLIQMVIVIPLIFYINTKEHYWTSKHTTMLFMTALGLGCWLLVRRHLPRFRVPFAWPVAFILLGATLSTLAAVNMIEGQGYLLAIYGSAIVMFLSVQVLNTSKRIHLFVMTMIIVAVIMSLYGLAQSYLLLPMEMVYAQQTRAPVSTIGNKNYAAYFLDLAIPLAIALAVCRRDPLQTLSALMMFFICRWHFVLCDTRAGTISMSIGVIVSCMLVAYFHGRRFRLLLYFVFLEPLMFAAMEASDLTLDLMQQWGRTLASARYKGAVGASLNRVLPEEMRSIKGYIVNWFDTGNEVFLGINLRLFALMSGVAISLVLFYLVLKFVKNHYTQILAAAFLAFIPYWFALLTMPGNVPPAKAAVEVVSAVQDSNIANRELAVQVLQQYGVDMCRAAQPYNDFLLAKHQDVAAMMAFSLFVCMATFLLFRWFDKNQLWRECLAAIAAIGGWFLVFLAIRSGSSIAERFFSGFTGELTNVWPVPMKAFHRNHSVLTWAFRHGSFAVYSLAALTGAILSMQYLPAVCQGERLVQVKNKLFRYSKIAVVVFGVVLLIGIWTHPRISRTRSAFMSELRSDGLVDAIFGAGKTYFNTRGQVEGQRPDGATGFRLEIYQACLRKVRDNPILGIGPGNFKIIHPYPKYETALERRILGKEVLGRKAHNDFLEDTVENGMIGLLGIIWLFAVAVLLLIRAHRLIHPPFSNTAVFNNTITWGLAWSLLAILIHAQFEAPLLQPASTYPCWIMLGVIYHLYRVQRRRVAYVGIQTNHETSRTDDLVPELPPASSYQPTKSEPVSVKSAKWLVMLLVVSSLMGGFLIREYVGEMWLRWGMVFSEAGFEKFGYVFNAIEKSSIIHPHQMETNYIGGRYYIDALSKVYHPWRINLLPDEYSEAERQAAAEQIRTLRQENQLDIDRILEYAQRGIDLHIRDVYMNPNYKWAHNNMGVLYDKLSQIYLDLAKATNNEEKKSEYQALAREAELNSRNCYGKALEVDDLQVYALYNLGHGALREGNLDLASKYFERTLLADPNRGDVYYFLTKVQMSQKNYAKAIEAIDGYFVWADSSTRHVIPRNHQQELEMILYQICQVLLEGEDPQLGLTAAQVLNQHFPKPGYRSLLAESLVNSGSVQQGLDMIEEVINEDNRQNYQAVYTKAKALALLGDASQAIDLLDELLKGRAAALYRGRISNDQAFGGLLENPALRKLVNPAADESIDSVSQ